jgi:hypothetical protein
MAMAWVGTRTSFTSKFLLLAVGSCFAAGTALADPPRPIASKGAASILWSGERLQFTDRPSAVILFGTEAQIDVADLAASTSKRRGAAFLVRQHGWFEGA